MLISRGQHSEDQQGSSNILILQNKHSSHKTSRGQPLQTLTITHSFTHAKAYTCYYAFLTNQLQIAGHTTLSPSCFILQPTTNQHNHIKRSYLIQQLSVPRRTSRLQHQLCTSSNPSLENQLWWNF